MLDTISMAEKLQGDYRLVFEKADMYSTVSGSGDQNIEDDRLMNLFDLLIEAQHEGKPVEKIVGNDIEAFCKEYFIHEEEPEKWYISFPKNVYHFVRWVAILSLIDLLLPAEGETIFTMTINTVPFFLGLILGLILTFVNSNVLKPAISKSNKIKPIALYGVILLLFLGGVIGSVFIFEKYNLEISALGVFAVSLGYVVIYLVIRSIYRYRKFGTIQNGTKEEIKKRKEEKKAKKEFNAQLNDDFSIGLHKKSMAKFYQKKQKKALKKNKEYTFEDYAARIRKEFNQTKKSNRITICIFIALVLILTVIQMFVSDPLDALLYGLILSVVEFPICLWTVKSTTQNNQFRMHIIEECEKQGIDIVEYAQMK